MGKLVRSKRWLHFLEEYVETCIGDLFDIFLKLLYLIDYLFIHPCFASFSLLVEVNSRILKGHPPSIATQCYDQHEACHYSLTNVLNQCHFFVPSISFFRMYMNGACDGGSLQKIVNTRPTSFQRKMSYMPKILLKTKMSQKGAQMQKCGNYKCKRWAQWRTRGRWRACN